MKPPAKISEADDRGIRLPDINAVLVSGQTCIPVALKEYSAKSFVFEYVDIGSGDKLHEKKVSLKFEFALKKWEFSCRVNGVKLLDVTNLGSDKIEDLITALRKESHIQLCNQGSVEGSSRDSYLASLRFQQQTLPDFNWDEISTASEFLGGRFSWPFLITGMTGGIENGKIINERLAAAAINFNIPMGVGSQRIALENPDAVSTFQLKKKFPRLFLIANLGFSEILRSKDPLGTAKRAVDMIDADAFAIHLNVLQELIQSEGEHRIFKGFFDSLQNIVSDLGVPVMLKEVGAGLDYKTAVRAVEAGILALDVGGRGGTSWAFIEGQRASSQVRQRLGELFRDWGTSTAEALNNLKPLHNRTTLVATGGVRSGLDAARLLALGAHCVGFGLPLFKAALLGEKEVLNELEFLSKGLKTTMLLTNSKDLAALRGKLLDP